MKRASYWWVMMVALALSSATVVDGANAKERVMSEEELMDRLSGFWIGQLLGNYIGFPFENNYVEEPIPVLVDRVYTADYDGDPELKINTKDRRGHIPIMVNALRGAFSDDDTDIEFVTLHAVEKYGLDITYPEITQMWMTHINDYIWVANREARNLMDRGLVAPDTGRKQNNKHWFQIDPQLVNEIWSAFYPGMTQQAARRALWGRALPMTTGERTRRSRTGDDQRRVLREGCAQASRHRRRSRPGRGTLRRGHSRRRQMAFRERRLAGHAGSNPRQVLRLQEGVVRSAGECRLLPGEWVDRGHGCPIRRRGLHENSRYRNVRRVRLRQPGGNHRRADRSPQRPERHGRSRRRANHEPSGVGKWDKPFNDQYVNISRDEIKHRTPISEIVQRIAAVAKTAILEHGGRMEVRDGETVYVVNTDF